MPFSFGAKAFGCAKCRPHVGAKSALLRLLFLPAAEKKPSARSLAPPFPQKGTLGSPARLQAPSRRLTLATTLLRRYPELHIKNLHSPYTQTRAPLSAAPAGAGLFLPAHREGPYSRSTARWRGSCSTVREPDPTGRLCAGAPSHTEYSEPHLKN